MQEAELRTKFFTRMDEVQANAAAQSQSENRPGGLWGDGDDDTFCIPYWYACRTFRDCGISGCYDCFNPFSLQGVCFDYF